MSKKNTEIPVPAFLKKYIETTYGNELILSERIMLTENNDCRWVGKWDTLVRSHKQFIKVEMYNPCPRRMLAVKRAFEKEFYDVFFLIVNTKEKLDLEVMDSIRKFMKDYKITDDDYSLETLYRLYYRFKHKHRLRNLKNKKSKEKAVL